MPERRTNARKVGTQLKHIQAVFSEPFWSISVAQEHQRADHVWLIHDGRYHALRGQHTFCFHSFAVPHTTAAYYEKFELAVQSARDELRQQHRTLSPSEHLRLAGLDGAQALYE